MDLKTISAIDLAEAIRSKKISSTEAVSSALERLKGVHEAFNAVVSTDAEEASPRRKRSTPPLPLASRWGLAGVPAHKDMFDRAGKIPELGRPHPPREALHGGRHADCAPQSRRQHPDRRAAYDRVRLRPNGAQLRARPCPQPV